MRNGNNINLKPINIKGKKFLLIHTCAFDSIFQIFLISLFLSEDFKAKVTDYSNKNMFFKQISDTFSQGLSRNRYYLRAIILSDIFEAKETFNNCFLINCEVSVGVYVNNCLMMSPALKNSLHTTNVMICERKYFLQSKLKYRIYCMQNFLVQLQRILF